jgi:choline dehydrogenase-like flavoprotein
MIRQADFIVVGAGSAGCAVAARLAEAGHQVLLVEAGRSDRRSKTRIPALVGGIVHNPGYDWCYKAEPDPTVGGPGHPWPAGKRLGGGSSINGMMFIRGHRYDYDRWASLGATGWDYASVLPFFRRIEDNESGADEWRGTGGPITVSECRSSYPVVDAWIAAAQQAGIPRSRDLNGEIAEGVDRVQLSQRGGLRCSSATGYLSSRPRNLEVLVEAEVDRLLTDQTRVTGVVVRQDGATRNVRARCGVIVSAGALNTPRLLMLSGMGPAHHLRDHGIRVIADLPGVGSNLQEHVGTHLVDEILGRTLNDDARGLRGALQVLRFALQRRGALTTGIAHAQAFVRTRPGLPAPNIQLALSSFAFDMAPSGNLVLRRNSSISTLVALMRPEGRGTVRLAAPDPRSPPRIEHRLLATDSDLDQLVEGMQVARDIVRQSALEDFRIREIRPGVPDGDLQALRETVRTGSIPLYHPVGTAKIGSKDDPLAVLDPDLRVRGIEGLWVADASAIPTVPAANTNATCIMIGDKASTHILRSFRN